MDVIPPIHRIHWKKTWRVIPTRYPTENLLGRVTDPNDRPLVDRLEQFTSTRNRFLRKDIPFFSSGETAIGPGSQYIMAAFSYSLHNPSRFSDGSYSVYYTARTLATAIKETVYHREKFYRSTKEGPMQLQMRTVVAELKGSLHDIRGNKYSKAQIYSPKTWEPSQLFGRKLKNIHSKGIVYRSVRYRKGECAAVFIPSQLKYCREDRGLVYEWDGKKIAKIYELREYISQEK